MQHQRNMTARSPQPQPDGISLLADTYRDLGPLVADLSKLERALALLEDAGSTATKHLIAKERAAIKTIEPSVTFIGQVKAGKTTLVNALIGRPGLLPSDINPWTSVVTSLHLSPRLPPSAERSEFRFFTDEEWSRLLTKGGRMGELASRAGADAELERVRAQLQQMRDASRRRLGQNFEMLLGQTHKYGFANEELIQRYVCLGDDTDPADAPASTQGRFADITRSADLYLRQPGVPMPICLRDTPGVNDTFLVREQITINAIRASRLCVVVLSAHQALSTVDLGLIRLISNVPSREVIIFVNRIDELNDPVRDVPAIRTSILETLKAQNGPQDAEILFGSAHWAAHALAGQLNAIGQASGEALIAMAEHYGDIGKHQNDPVATIWALSGLPGLGRAISARIAHGEGAEAVERSTAATRNIARAIEAARIRAEDDAHRRSRPSKPRGTLDQDVDRCATELTDRFANDIDTLLESNKDRLAGACQTFLARATAALAEHLEDNGDQTVWTYDPIGLRLLLRSGYQRFAARATKTAKAALSDAAATIAAMSADHFQSDPEVFRLDPPSVPQPPVPATLGQTIALDIKGRWWTRWWHRRRSAEAYAEEFRALIAAEIEPVADDLHRQHAVVFAEDLKAQLSDFLDAQTRILKDAAHRSERELEDLRAEFQDASGQRQAAFRQAHDILFKSEPAGSKEGAP